MHKRARLDFACTGSAKRPVVVSFRAHVQQRQIQLELGAGREYAIIQVRDVSTDRVVRQVSAEATTIPRRMMTVS